MNKKNVLTCAGGGGEFLNRIHYGGNPAFFNNYWCSCRDNITKFNRQH